jgi:hypothetical protein
MSNVNWKDSKEARLQRLAEALDQVERFRMQDFARITSDRTDQERAIRVFFAGKAPDGEPHVPMAATAVFAALVPTGLFFVHDPDGMAEMELRLDVQGHQAVILGRAKVKATDRQRANDDGSVSVGPRYAVAVILAEVPEEK